MSLARSWRRALYGASGTALLVPATIAGALAVLALAGGFARIGVVGQAFSGPSVPASASGRGNAGSAAHAAASLTRVLAAVGTPVAGAGGTLVAVPVGRGVAPVGARGGGGGGGGAGIPTQGSGGTGSGGGGTGSGGGGTGSGGGGTGSGSSGSSSPTIIDGVVKAGSSVTQKLPGPVGTTGTNTLQSLGSTLNKIAPLRLPSGK